MKLRVLGAAAVVCLISTVTFAETDLVSTKAQMSYALGVTMGKHIKDQGVPLDDHIYADAFEIGYQGEASELSDDKIHSAMMAFQKQVLLLQEEQTTVVSEQNKQAGKTFLAENKTKDGVVTTDSGLQYKIIQAGSGDSPKRSDEVEVNYEGRLIDGTVFDSSFQRGQPAVFPVGAVISGWTEALQMMKPGSQWELFIPAELAYGERGIGQIGPNSTLIFTVDLIEVK